MGDTPAVKDPIITIKGGGGKNECVVIRVGRMFLRDWGHWWITRGSSLFNSRYFGTKICSSSIVGRMTYLRVCGFLNAIPGSLLASLSIIKHEDVWHKLLWYRTFSEEMILAAKSTGSRGFIMWSLGFFLCGFVGAL